MSGLYFVPQPKIPWAWLTLEGNDAADFLQRLSTIDAASMKDGQGQSAFFLNGQGKTQAYFTLWKISQTSFGLEHEAHQDHPITEWIEKYHFTEDLNWKLQDEGCVWVFEDGTDKKLSVEQVDSLRLCHHGSANYGRNWTCAWGPQEALEKLKKDKKEITSAELDAWRIPRLTPLTSSEVFESGNPLELGMIQAISQTKGCYPGQEVIEKIIAKGAPAQRLSLVRGQNGQPPRNEPLLDNEQKVGRITSSVQEKNGFLALALIRKTHAKEGTQLQIHGNPVEVVEVSQFQ